jgi:two-component system response regulator CpxR
MKNDVICKNILIAEDNKDIRETIQEALEGEGYQVYCAKNGKEALSRLKTLSSPTLVLLDLMMPVMSGWEFLDAQESETAFASHKVVTISAIAPTKSLQDPTPLKTAGNLLKPLSLEPLLKMIERFCEQPIST